MAKIKSTLSITSNQSDYSVVQDQGPLSVALALNTTDDITVDIVDQDMYTVPVDSGDGTPDAIVILDGSEKAEAAGAAANGLSGYTAGSMGCYVYLKNTGTTNKIAIGLSPSSVHDADGATNLAYNDAPPGPDDATANTTGLSEATGKTFRTMTLNPGEFAFFPFDYTGDLYAEAIGSTSTLEVWIFDRG